MHISRNQASACSNKLLQVEASLNELKQVWTNLNKFEQVWASLNKFEKVLTSFNKFKNKFQQVQQVQTSSGKFIQVSPSPTRKRDLWQSVPIYQFWRSTQKISSFLCYQSTIEPNRHAFRSAFACADRVITIDVVASLNLTKNFKLR